MLLGKLLALASVFLYAGLAQSTDESRPGTFGVSLKVDSAAVQTVIDELLQGPNSPWRNWHLLEVVYRMWDENYLEVRIAGNRSVLSFDGQGYRSQELSEDKVFGKAQTHSMPFYQPIRQLDDFYDFKQVKLTRSRASQLALWSGDDPKHRVVQVITRRSAFQYGNAKERQLLASDRMSDAVYYFKTYGDVALLVGAEDSIVRRFTKLPMSFG